MSCEQSRDEYIAAVNDLIDMTRVAAQAREAYIRSLKEHPMYQLDNQGVDWRRVTEGLERLVAEERRALSLYSTDSARHRAAESARHRSH